MIRFVALFSFISFVFPIAAAERIDMYSAAVQVQTQQEADRNAAFTDALKQVVVKITGDEESLDNPELEPVLAKSRSYVSGFSYQRNSLYSGQPESNGEERDPSADASSAVFAQSLPEKEYILKVQFSDDALLQQIRDIGLPVWGALRPSIIAWIVMQENGERHLVNSDYPALNTSLAREAERAGLPIFLPVGDLQDLSSVNLNELWGLFPSSVSEASQRYPNDYRLLGRVYQADEGLELKWTLLMGSIAKTGGAKSVDYPSLWRQMTSVVAQQLAEQFAVVSDPTADAQELRILVSGIDQFIEYASLVEHVERLSSVEHVSVRQVYQDKVNLGIKLRGSRANFEQQVALAGKLQLVAPPFSQETELSSAQPPAEREDASLTQDDQFAAVELNEMPQSLNFYWVPDGGA